MSQSVVEASNSEARSQEKVRFLILCLLIPIPLLLSLSPEFPSMFRSALFAAAIFGVVSITHAEEPDLSGHWQLRYSSRATSYSEQTFFFVKVEMKDGKPTATIVGSPIEVKQPDITGVEVHGKTITFKTTYLGWSFEGTMDTDGKSITGNLGTDKIPSRARLTRIDKSELTREEAATRIPPPALVAESIRLVNAPQLRNQARLETDPDKRKELFEMAEAALKDMDEKSTKDGETALLVLKREKK
jgi:hypothetical protein